MAHSKVCDCGHHKVFPALVVIFGLAFLLEELGTIDPATVGIVWPILVIIGGIIKLGGRECHCCSK